MKNELNNICASSPFGEVRLFRWMVSILAKKNRLLFIKETHGSKGFVEFTSKVKRKRMIWTKEISDLMFVIYSKKKQETKIFLLQSKFHRKRTSPFLVFHGDYLQLELLRDKPLINSRNNLRLPDDFLRLANGYKSFRTYGVFYRDRNGEIDFLYTVSDLLKECSLLKQVFGKIEFNVNKKNSTTRHITFNKNELLSTSSIDHFEKNLLNFKIGAPIKIDSKLSIYVKSLINYIREYLGNSDLEDLFKNIIDSTQHSTSDTDILEPISCNMRTIIIEVD